LRISPLREYGKTGQTWTPEVELHEHHRRAISGWPSSSSQALSRPMRRDYPELFLTGIFLPAARNPASQRSLPTTNFRLEPTCPDPLPWVVFPSRAGSARQQ
jgi:hypothetical protein